MNKDSETLMNPCEHFPFLLWRRPSEGQSNPNKERCRVLSYPFPWGPWVLNTQLGAEKTRDAKKERKAKWRGQKPAHTQTGEPNERVSWYTPFSFNC